jgi:hypothetical protein
MYQKSIRQWIVAPVFAAVLGMAAGEARAQAAVDTNNTVIADFETNLGSTMWNGYWFHFNDANSPSAADSTLKGNSVITSLDSMGYPFTDTSGYYDRRSYPLGPTGEADSHSLRMAFKFGDRLLSCGAACTYEPYVGWALILTTYHFAPADTFDLTGATAISFWAKSDTDTVTVNYSLIIRDSIDTPDYSQAIKVGPTWKKYSISLNPATTLLAQPTWAVKKPFNMKHVAGMGFGFNRGDNKKITANGMSIDDITIENWKYVDPEIIDAIRSYARRAGSKAAYRLQIKGSQVNLIRADGDRITPFSLNGRAFPVR